MNEDAGEFYLIFGSSAKTSKFIVDGLHAWWEQRSPDEREAVSRLQY
ncbi:hypothetical protein [Aquisalimonas sp.]|nr:hypothetical protein [Aquisalimonas sp.]